MMEMMMMLSLSLKSLEEMGREHDGSNDGVVLAGEVVHLLLLGVGVAPQQLVVLDHLALLADRLHVVLVVVARLKEGARCLDVFNTAAAFCCSLGLGSVVEPFHLDFHVACPALPHGLDAADVGSVRSASGEEDGAVAHSNRLLLFADRLVEQLPRLGCEFLADICPGPEEMPRREKCSNLGLL